MIDRDGVGGEAVEVRMSPRMGVGAHGGLKEQDGRIDSIARSANCCSLRLW